MITESPGYVSKTGIKQLDPLLSRGGLLSIMPTVLLLCSGMAFGGILERSRVLEVLLDAVLKGARSAVRLVASVLAAAYIINLGTGSQMLAVIVPGLIVGGFKIQSDIYGVGHRVFPKQKKAGKSPAFS